MPSENPFPEFCNVRQEGTLGGLRQSSYYGMEKGLGPGMGLGKGYSWLGEEGKAFNYVWLPLWFRGNSLTFPELIFLSGKLWW